MFEFVIIYRINKFYMKFCLAGGDMVDHFYLNQTGELYLIKAVDRDGDVTGTPINFINLVIWATPLGYLTFDKYSTVPGTQRMVSQKIEMRPPDDYDSSNTTLLWAQVTIKDINDHPPKFRNQNLSVGITRKTQFQETIFTLSVYIIVSYILGENVDICLRLMFSNLIYM